MKHPDQYTPIPKAPKPAKAPKRLAPMSKKRRAALPQREQVRNAVTARGCQGPLMGAPLPCAGPLDPHEPRGGSERNLTWLDVEQVICLCRRHHDWVHAHPRAAYALGLLIKSGPARQPTYTRTGER